MIIYNNIRNSTSGSGFERVRARRETRLRQLTSGEFSLHQPGKGTANVHFDKEQRHSNIWTPSSASASLPRHARDICWQSVPEHRGKLGFSLAKHGFTHRQRTRFPSWPVVSWQLAVTLLLSHWLRWCGSYPSLHYNRRGCLPTCERLWGRVDVCFFFFLFFPPLTTVTTVRLGLGPTPWLNVKGVSNTAIWKCRIKNE